MARLPFITGGILLLMGSVCLMQGQAPRPLYPGQRPVQPPVTMPQAQRPQVPGATGNAPVGSQPQQAVSRPVDSPLGPPVPPVVIYRDGLLTVQALNSTLSSVVTAIRNKTGIEFEGMENISERVAISLGPAPEADVLTAIFTGSRYDFVALGRPDSPSIVQRVILTVKNRPGAPAEAQAQPRPTQQGEGDEEEVPDEQVNADPQDAPVQPPPIPQQQPPQPENQQQQPKTPEQLLQELQQMQNQKAPPDPQNPSTAPRKVPPRNF